MTKNTYGTGSFVLMHVGDRCPELVEGLLTTVGWALAGRLPALPPRGRHLRHRRRRAVAAGWARDHRAGRGRRRSWPRRSPTPAGSRWSSPSPASAARGGTPTPAARCSGSRGAPPGPTSPAAVLESMALQTRRRHLDERRLGVPRSRRCKRRRRAAANDLLAPAPGRPPRGAGVAACGRRRRPLGAAYLAGLAEGVWASPAEITANWQLDADLACRGPGRARRRPRRAGEAVERSRAWADDEPPTLATSTSYLVGAVGSIRYSGRPGCRQELNRRGLWDGAGFGVGARVPPVGVVYGRWACSEPPSVTDGRVVAHRRAPGDLAKPGVHDPGQGRHLAPLTGSVGRAVPGRPRGPARPGGKGAQTTSSGPVCPTPTQRRRPAALRRRREPAPPRAPAPRRRGPRRPRGRRRPPTRRPTAPEGVGARAAFEELLGRRRPTRMAAVSSAPRRGSWRRSTARADRPRRPPRRPAGSPGRAGPRGRRVVGQVDHELVDGPTGAPLQDLDPDDHHLGRRRSGSRSGPSAPGRSGSHIRTSVRPPWPGNLRMDAGTGLSLGHDHGELAERGLNGAGFLTAQSSRPYGAPVEARRLTQRGKGPQSTS